MNLKNLHGNLVTPQERMIALLYECIESTLGVHTLPTVRFSEHWGDGPCLIRSRLVQAMLAGQENGGGWVRLRDKDVLLVKARN